MTDLHQNILGTLLGFHEREKKQLQIEQHELTLLYVILLKQLVSSVGIPRYDAEVVLESFDHRASSLSLLLKKYRDREQIEVGVEYANLLYRFTISQTLTGENQSTYAFSGQSSPGSHLGDVE